MGNFNKSVLDNLSDALAEPMRKIQDVKNALTGTRVSLLRISKEKYSNYDDMLGDSSYTMTTSTSIIDNCVLQFPLSEVEIISQLQDSEDKNYDETGIDLFTILPITLVVMNEGTFVNEITRIKPNDLFVYVVFDEKLNKIPIIMSVEKPIGHFFGRNVIRRNFQLTLERGTLEDDIQKEIDNYVDSFGIPEISDSYPQNNATDFPANSGIILDFNIPVEKNTFETTTSGIIFSPNVSGIVYSWDDDYDNVIITPSSFSGETSYTLTIDKNAVISEYGYNMKDDFSLIFTIE